MSQPRNLLNTLSFPMRWGDMDAFGHLNNSVYFTYFEQVRIDWLAGMGYDVFGRSEQGVVIVTASCHFRRAVTYPATVEVKLYGGPPGRSSFPTYHELRVLADPRGGPYATGEATVVWVDQASGRSTPLPDAIRARLPGGV